MDHVRLDSFHLFDMDCLFDCFPKN